MALVVQKYGGTSVGSVEKIKNVARRVARTFDEGNQVVEVKSRTDGLLFSRNVDRFARPGRIIAKIAGAKPLCESEGDLLTL